MPTPTRKRPAKKIAEPISPSMDVRQMFENCVGCKWTLHVLAQVRAGVNRPGALTRSAEGLTQKVLQQRLKKLTGYGILRRRSFATVPPRVEYALTSFGTQFLKILDQIDSLASGRAKG